MIRRYTRKLTLALALLTVCFARGDAAQKTSPPNTQLPALDVVSIRPNKSGTPMMSITSTPDGMFISGTTAHMLLREALGISNNQLEGEPEWMNSEHFDIDAKVAAEDMPKLKNLKPADRFAMLLPVFEDRFGLKFHHETKDLTQYVLLIANGGPKIRKVEPGDMYPNGLKRPDGKESGTGMVRVQAGVFIGQGVPIASLVRYLSFQFGSPVIDKTGLIGKYDFDLHWAPDEMNLFTIKMPDDNQPGAENSALPATTGPSIFTALEEQLGLKLEAHKEPADVIVIDHIEQPSAN